MYVRLILLICALVMFSLLALNVALEIDVITRHPFEWTAGGFAFFAAASLPWPNNTRSNP